MRINSQCKYPTVFFGKYIIPNGSKPNDVFIREPIEWLVVENDLEKKCALLVSKYAVDWEGFADCPLLGHGYKTSWEKSYSRKWLNDDFYKECFSSDEQIMIIPTATEQGNNRITDKVFLLSAEEVQMYFGDQSTAATLIPMADFFDSVSSEENPIIVNYYPVIWWTRTSGATEDLVVCVNEHGLLQEMDSNCNQNGVRPAIWIKM